MVQNKTGDVVVPTKLLSPTSTKLGSITLMVNEYSDALQHSESSNPKTSNAVFTCAKHNWNTNTIYKSLHVQIPTVTMNQPTRNVFAPCRYKTLCKTH